MGQPQSGESRVPLPQKNPPTNAAPPHVHAGSSTGQRIFSLQRFAIRGLYIQFYLQFGIRVLQVTYGN